MCDHCMNRRQFAAMTTAGLTGTALGLSSATAADTAAVEPWNPDTPPLVTGRALRVQPILAHGICTPREKSSWRSWSEIVNEPAAAEEMRRIGGELTALSARADFPLEMLPPAKVTTAEQAASVQRGDFDVVLLYAASNAGLFRPCCAADPRRDTIVFVRHKSGPTYYGYECLGVRFFQIPSPELWQGNTAESHGPVTLDDVVVDDYDEVLWRLRALYGLKNFVGQRVLALGGAQGKYDGTAPEVARKRFHLEIVELAYDELAARLRAVAADAKLQQQCAAWTDRYLALPNTRLETRKQFVHKAFALYVVFKQWLREHQAPAITINACMGTIISMSDTTACMPLSWLNDEGQIALCESDFVVVPAGILLHYVAGKPVFMHNSTFPHKAIVTCAHCTAPRRMDGRRYEPVRIMTHYESDFGAAPKVEMPLGQPVCAISPEYASGRWVGIKAVVRDNPELAICRSQQDVEIEGNWKRLIAETRDSHWMMVYGDYLREVGYAARKIGLTWDNVSDTET
ncbi:MAG: hypothetical protein JXB62_02120 [Pirellulales bacterium]|nr:hypothetical protein [Pirellulales bacterium]